MSLKSAGKAAKVYNQMMRYLKFSLLSLLVVPIIALAEGENGSIKEQKVLEIQAEQLYAGSQCGDGNAAAAIWITDQEQLKQAYQLLQKGKIGGPTYKLPAIDFKKAGGLLINMGQKRTGGYGIKLLVAPVTVKDMIATVQVHWLEPTPGGIQIQVLTSPCVLIKLPLNAYTHIKIVDQTKSLKAEVKIEL